MSSTYYRTVIILLMVMLAGCSQTGNEATSTKVIQSDQVDLTTVKTSRYVLFHYQLQGVTYDSLKDLNADVIVIDPDDAELTKEEVSSLGQEGKLVLAYLSIGEAEDYRDYWQSSWKPGNPEFLDRENPEWKGNYKVKYWLPEWQAIILNKSEKISEEGYDGAYLDIIDAYGYYEDKGRGSAAEEMIDFVKAVKNRAATHNPDFIVVPQNSPELYSYPDYAATIAGFGKEDTWYSDNSQQDSEETTYALSFLDQAINEGKFVLAIDYPAENEKVCDFYTRCKSHKFVCTVSNRELDMDSPVLCQS